MSACFALFYLPDRRDCRGDIMPECIFICKVGCDSLIDNAKLRPESGFRKFIGLNFSAVLSAHKGYDLLYNT